VTAGPAVQFIQAYAGDEIGHLIDDCLDGNIINQVPCDSVRLLT